MDGNSEIIKDNERVKEGFKVEIVIALISISLSVTIGLLFTFSSGFILLMALLFLGLCLYIFRPRNCPNCSKRMTRVYGASAFPEYYRCEDCKKYIKILVQGDNWA